MEHGSIMVSHLVQIVLLMGTHFNLCNIKLVAHIQQKPTVIPNFMFY